MKVFAWIKSLFDHPKTTVAGIGALAGAAAIGYGMYTGAVPINAQSVATAGGLASAGLAGIAGKDAVATQAVEAAAAAAPEALTLIDQYKSMQAEAQDAQAKLDTFATVTQAIAQALPPAQQ